MSPNAEQVFQAARALPPAEQVELIDALIAALDEGVAPPLDPDWMQEIQRRSQEYDAGLVKPVPWSEVQAAL